MKKYAIKISINGDEKQVFLNAISLGDAITQALGKTNGGQVLIAREIDSKKMHKIFDHILSLGV